MPKILINEIDQTTPGIPSGYANYSVLIPGFQEEFTETELTAAKKELTAYKEAVQKIENGEKVTLPE